MEEKLKLTRELASCLRGIEIQLIPEKQGLLPHVFREGLYGDLLPTMSDERIQNFFNELMINYMYIIKGPVGLCCIVIPTENDWGYLCIGPCLTDSLSERQVRNNLQSSSVGAHTLPYILSYLKSLPLMSEAQLYRLGVLVCHHLLGLEDPIPYQRIEYLANPFVNTNMPQNIAKKETSHIHQVEKRYEISAAMTEAVKQGNLSLAYGFIQNLQHGMKDLARTNNPLRNAQNICIILNTQLRHALENCHIHPYQLDKISEEIAIHIERLQSSEAAERFCGDIIRRYCELAMDNNYSHLNNLAKQAVAYIKIHLSENVTVKDTAKVLLVNANYLSGVFRQEVGMTFIDFLNQERVAQAAALIRYTNMSIQHIATVVGYNNTSYFARQFQRFYGCTPREYRAGTNA